MHARARTFASLLAAALLLASCETLPEPGAGRAPAALGFRIYEDGKLVVDAIVRLERVSKSVDYSWGIPSYGIILDFNAETAAALTALSSSHLGQGAQLLLGEEVLVTARINGPFGASMMVSLPTEEAMEALYAKLTGG